MKSLLLASTIFVCAVALPSTPAQAQVTASCENVECWTTAGRPTNPGAGKFGYNSTIGYLEFFNGTAWTTIDSKGDVNIAEYGACDPTITDHTQNVNNAIQVIRARGWGRLTGPSGCEVTFSGTLNFTDLTPAGYIFPSPLLPVGSQPGPIPGAIIIDTGGVIFTCQNVGGICVDALNTKHTYWLSFRMASRASAVPRIGFQYGAPCWVANTDRDCQMGATWNAGTTYSAGTIVYASDNQNYASIGSGNIGHDPTLGGGFWASFGPIKAITSSQNIFIQNMITGFYTEATKINYASEGSSEFKGYYSNGCDFGATCTGMAADGGKGYVVDCQQHFTKTGVWTNVQLGVGTDIVTGCQAPAFHGTVIQTISGTDLWIGGTFGMYVDESSYFSNGRSIPNITVYNNSTIFGMPGGVGQLYFKQHMENLNGQGKFFLTGTNTASYVIQGLEIRDTGSQADFSEFILDFANGINSVSIYNFDYYSNGPRQNGTWALFGAYQKLATAVTASSGTCTDGAKTFTVSGTGVAATVTGTVTGGVLGALTITSAGTFQVTPGTPATLSGGAGCSVNPTATATYSATPPPFNFVSGSINGINLTQLGTFPNQFAGTLCADAGCSFVAGTQASGVWNILGNNGQMYAPGNNALAWATGGALRGGIAAGGTWSIGGSSAASGVSNGAFIPLFQARLAQLSGAQAPYRVGYEAAAFGNDAFTAGVFFCAKSRNGTQDTHTIVQTNDALCRFSMQGSDGNKFQEAAAMRFEVDAAPSAGTSTRQGDIPGRIVLSTAGGSFYAVLPGTIVASGGSAYTPGSFDVTLTGGCATPPVINVTANAAGVVTTVNSITTAGVCATPLPTNPNFPSGGTGTQVQLTVQYSNQGDAISIDSTHAAAIRGVSTNSNAVAGWVGQVGTVQQSFGTVGTLVTGVAKTIAQISLTAGDWECSGVVARNLSGTGTLTQAIQSISATDNTLSGSFIDGSQTLLGALTTGAIANTGTLTQPVGPFRRQLAATGTTYLVAQDTYTAGAGFTDTPGGGLYCRRMR